MKIALTSVYVDDQAKALAFYTDVLGFQKRHDIPLGDDSWLTVVSPSAPDRPELLLEPAGHPAVKPYRRPRWSRTAFPSRSSPSMTSRPSTTASRVPPGSSSPNHRPTSEHLPWPCSTTPAGNLIQDHHPEVAARVRARNRSLAPNSSAGTS